MAKEQAPGTEPGTGEITIVSPGFEDPALEDGDYTPNVTGWQEGWYDLTATDPTAWVGYPWGAGVVNPDVEAAERIQGQRCQVTHLSFLCDVAGHPTGSGAGPPQVVKRLVGVGQPVRMDVGPQRDVCGKREEFARVAARQVRHRTDDPFLP